jgi:hypothetical protein
MTSPEWLTSGALVRVKGGSSSSPDRIARVFSVHWPWLVYLDGRPGAVHPLRLRRVRYLYPIDHRGRP